MTADMTITMCRDRIVWVLRHLFRGHVVKSNGHIPPECNESKRIKRRAELLQRALNRRYAGRL